jgi:hypothetical protein
VLPDDQDPGGIRSDSPPHARPLRFAVLQPIGLALIIVSAVPAFIAVLTFVRRRRPRVRRPPRVVRQEERASLDAVRAMEIDTIDGRRGAFTQLDALVRDHLREICGVPGGSLTPQEVPLALATSGADAAAEVVASVLATCELARYAPPHAMPSADTCREAIARVEDVIANPER